MATNLLKKVWLSVSYHHRGGSSCSKSNRASSSLRDDPFWSSSTGEFDRLPLDIFLQILKFLGPKESAKLTAVCKSWRYVIVSDNRLWMQFLQYHHPWDSIFFAETYLRLGFPLQSVCSSFLSFIFYLIYV